MIVMVGNAIRKLVNNHFNLHSMLKAQHWNPWIPWFFNDYLWVVVVSSKDPENIICGMKIFPHFLVHLCAHCRQLKVSQRLSYDLATPSMAKFQKEVKSVCHRDTCLPCLQQYVS